MYYRQLDPKLRGAIEDLTEHPASVIMNVLFVYLLCLVLFHGSRWRVWAFSVFLPTIVAAYFLSQRRAAMVALFAGLIILAVILFFRRRPTFMKIVPAAIVLIVLFVAATWNTQGGIGLPATAVKSALFPDTLSTTDAASAEYRDLEAYNLWFTIRASPITGQGFGQPFLVVRAMPDISFFEFWQYLPHNSVLWVWIKTGFFGFVSMLFVVGRTIQLGARSARRVRSADDAVLVTVGLAVHGDVHGVRVRRHRLRDPACGDDRAVRRLLCGLRDGLGLQRARDLVDVPRNDELGMIRRGCLPIRHGDVLLGFLWVIVGDNPLTGIEKAACNAAGRTSPTTCGAAIATPTSASAARATSSRRCCTARSPAWRRRCAGRRPAPTRSRSPTSSPIACGCAAPTTSPPTTHCWCVTRSTWRRRSPRRLPPAA